MTGDVNLTHIRDALTDKGWSDDSPDECPACGRVLPDHCLGCAIGPEAWSQLAAAEAVIQAARAYVNYPMEGTRRKALRTALAALEDVQ